MTEIIPYEFTNEQVDLIKRTIMHPQATDDELALFLYQAQRTGLDPLSRQIHAIFRWNNQQNRNVMSIQTSIDGYRLIADRTGAYAGSDDYLFDEGVSQFEHMQKNKQNPSTATVTVYKIVSGQRVPFTATAEWNAYFPGDKGGFMWKKMPYLMLGKCAEALALRKAFPAELSGVYTREEMEQAGGEIVDAEVTEIESKIADKNLDAQKEKPERPFPPDVLKEGIQTRAASHKNAGHRPTGQDRNMIAACVNDIFAGDDGKRHELFKWLTGHASTKEMGGEYVLAIKDWLAIEAFQQPPSEFSMKEAQSALVAAQKAAGQQELIQ